MNLSLLSVFCPPEILQSAQKYIAALEKENDLLKKELQKYSKELETVSQFANNLTNNTMNSPLNLLSKKISAQIQERNLPPAAHFLRVSIPWIEGFETIIKNYPFGTLIQPLPHFRPESLVIKRRFSTIEELEQLFPTRLRKNFIGDGWALLEPPMELQWSCTTNKLTAIFTYSSYIFNGKFNIFIFINFRKSCIYYTKFQKESCL